MCFYVYRYVKRKKGIKEGEIITMKSNFSTRRVFTEEQENLLKQYIVTCSQMCYGQSDQMNMTPTINFKIL